MPLFVSVALGAIVCSFGVTLGAHRLYTHKSYKAKWPLRLVLNVLQTAAGQVSIRQNFPHCVKVRCHLFGLPPLF